MLCRRQSPNSIVRLPCWHSVMPMQCLVCGFYFVIVIWWIVDNAWLLYLISPNFTNPVLSEDGNLQIWANMQISSSKGPSWINRASAIECSRSSFAASMSLQLCGCCVSGLFVAVSRSDRQFWMCLWILHIFLLLHLSHWCLRIGY
jgi:hypothetical protein